MIPYKEQRRQSTLPAWKCFSARRRRCALVVRFAFTNRRVTPLYIFRRRSWMLPPLLLLLLLLVPARCIEGGNVHAIIRRSKNKRKKVEGWMKWTYPSSASRSSFISLFFSLFLLRSLRISIPHSSPEPPFESCASPESERERR